MQGYSLPNIETRCIYEILFRWRYPLMSETLLIVCSGKNWFTRGRKDGCILLLTDERGCCTQPEKEHIQLANLGSLHVLNQKKKNINFTGNLLSISAHPGQFICHSSRSQNLHKAFLDLRFNFRILLQWLQKVRSVMNNPQKRRTVISFVHLLVFQVPSTWMCLSLYTRAWSCLLLLQRKNHF